MHFLHSFLGSVCRSSQKGSFRYLRGRCWSDHYGKAGELGIGRRKGGHRFAGA